MRALPIIVDLFVLLTVFSLVLFYTAFGNSAPNESIRSPVVFEVVMHFSNPVTFGEHPMAEVRLNLIGPDGAEVLGDVLAHPPMEGTQRFLVREAPDDAVAQVVIERINEAAFFSGQMNMVLRRLYPEPEEIELPTMLPGSARVLQLAVGGSS